MLRENHNQKNQCVSTTQHHPKHVEQFTDINKLYIVASCWTNIGIYFTIHGPLSVKLIEALIAGSEANTASRVF